MNNAFMPFLEHEADMARLERTNRRLWILCIILISVLVISISALVISNVWWYNYEKQYEYYEITQDATGGGTNNYIGNDNYGEVTNGETDYQRKTLESRR